MVNKMIKNSSAVKVTQSRPTKRTTRRVRRRYRGQQAVAAATNVGMVSTAPSRRIRTVPNGEVTISNKEIVLSVTGTPAAGVIPAAGQFITVSVSSGAFSWLSKFEAIYDKYVFRSIRITWVPTLPTTTSGSIAIYYDCDDQSTSTVFGAAATNERSLVTPVFQQASTQLPRHLIAALPWYSASTEATSPFTQGYIHATHTSVVLLNGSAATTTDIGYVMVDYVVCLKNASST